MLMMMMWLMLVGRARLQCKIKKSNGGLWQSELRIKAKHKTGCLRFFLISSKGIPCLSCSILALNFYQKKRNSMQIRSFQFLCLWKSVTPCTMLNKGLLVMHEYVVILQFAFSQLWFQYKQTENWRRMKRNRSVPFGIMLNYVHSTGYRGHVSVVMSFLTIHIFYNVL